MGENILKEGLLKRNQPSFDTVTNPNYVYLTDRITSAMHYGCKKAVYNREKMLYLFEVDIDSTALLVDEDEINIYSNGFPDQRASIQSLNGKYTVQNTLPIIHSVRVDFDINCS